MAERGELRNDITLVITQLRLQCICMALQIVQLVSQQASKKRLRCFLSLTSVLSGKPC